MTSTIIYEGNLRSRLTHLQSGTVIETDAPIDNMGKGERFSPTDLLATSLGSCMITTMAIRAADMQLNFDNTIISITKIMSKDAPRRVVKIIVEFNFATTFNATTQQKQQLERIALNCPVQKSLHPDIVVETTFNW